ncbi:MAG TPA: hypothetical protein VG895_02300 [Patescibacteria group bacterium]|nr:hypothetical protein [Patescibacteria group bacterium]
MDVKRYILFAAGILFGLSVVFIYKIITTHPAEPIGNIVQNIAKPDFDISKAPSQSIQGKILSMSGNIFWESRTATESSQISYPQILQQGESLQTGDNGNAQVEFPNEAEIIMDAKTEIDFIQTLPTEFVVNIASGSATFTKLNDPLEIRAGHLLTKINSGQTKIGIDETGNINLNIISGSITSAYNDQNLVSHEEDFNSPQRFTFDDLTRKFVF